MPRCKDCRHVLSLRDVTAGVDAGHVCVARPRWWDGGTPYVDPDADLPCGTFAEPTMLDNLQTIREFIGTFGDGGE